MDDDGNLRRLVQSLGHDFNNLLTGILGAISLARQDMPAGSPAGEKLEQALITARRAGFLAQQLLALAGSRRAPLGNAATDVNAILLESRELLEGALPSASVLSYELLPALPPARVDPWDLQGICYCLVSNAGDALDDTPGVVTVSTGIDASRVWIEVKDTGPGIAAEHLPKVCDAFFTTRPSRRGLGLHFVRTTAEACAGEVRILSSSPGTSVRIFLPGG
ncbi:MAG: HAMP domain-containing histidine kinase [Planctomycetes bacterium]|nr:HAMP domain-containing histidine kinase [Planctomycetota bacterium]